MIGSLARSGPPLCIPHSTDRVRELIRAAERLMREAPTHPVGCACAVCDVCLAWLYLPRDWREAELPFARTAED